MAKWARLSAQRHSLLDNFCIPFEKARKWRHIVRLYVNGKLRLSYWKCMNNNVYFSKTLRCWVNKQREECRQEVGHSTHNVSIISTKCNQRLGIVSKWYWLIDHILCMIQSSIQINISNEHFSSCSASKTTRNECIIYSARCAFLHIVHGWQAVSNLILNIKRSNQ